MNSFLLWNNLDNTYFTHFYSLLEVNGGCCKVLKGLWDEGSGSGDVGEWWGDRNGMVKSGREKSGNEKTGLEQEGLGEEIRKAGVMDDCEKERKGVVIND